MSVDSDVICGSPAELGKEQVEAIQAERFCVLQEGYVGLIETRTVADDNALLSEASAS
jgi:hypothetical protein